MRSSYICNCRSQNSPTSLMSRNKGIHESSTPLNTNAASNFEIYDRSTQNAILEATVHHASTRKKTKGVHRLMKNLQRPHGSKRSKAVNTSDSGSSGDEQGICSSFVSFQFLMRESYYHFLCRNI